MMKHFQLLHHPSKLYKYYYPTDEDRLRFDDELPGGYIRITSNKRFREIKDEVRLKLMQLNTARTPDTKWHAVDSVDATVKVYYEKRKRNGGGSCIILN